MLIRETPIEGLLILEPAVHTDRRGSFSELWSRRCFEEAGLHYEFVQDNRSRSTRRGTLRGIHFQKGRFAQAKLVSCPAGAVWDVAVDLRPESPSFGRHFALELSAENGLQLLLPRRFGHGFVTLCDGAELYYKVDNDYAPEAEGAVRWNDPELAVDWGVSDPILSDRDAAAPLLRRAETDY